ncbi:hypothetical protein N7533_008470 [Penicillium manginii]|uniref:uncharacterized protein n=1 Tax=Penicillium manginii TaxID=203109 RepID=UPI002546EFB5|nr:uncharacterized protein N7533_008470 [Penicillium manginii]KAJ5743600.1 hypothetical protein N7533_008470 [Penicillium manginii]
MTDETLPLPMFSFSFDPPRPSVFRAESDSESSIDKSADVEAQSLADQTSRGYDCRVPVEFDEGLQRLAALLIISSNPNPFELLSPTPIERESVVAKFPLLSMSISTPSTSSMSDTDSTEYPEWYIKKHGEIVRSLRVRIDETINAMQEYAAALASAPATAAKSVGFTHPPSLLCLPLRKALSSKVWLILDDNTAGQSRQAELAGFILSRKDVQLELSA